MQTRKFRINIDPVDLVPKSNLRRYYYAAFWLTVLQIISIALLYSYTPKVVPIFFTEPWGEARLAPKIYLALLPTFSLLNMVINLLLSKRAKVESELLPHTLAVASLVVVLMSMIATFGILQSVI